MRTIYRGQRKGDIRVMRWDHIPIHPNLDAALTRAPRNGLTILRRRDGQLFTESGFNAVWRRAKEKHGLGGSQFHGLRRNAVEEL
jgi:hypothetical protein